MSSIINNIINALTTNNNNNETYTCSLCKTECNGYGNNPFPLCEEKDYESRCCDDCNMEKVIPARMRQHQRLMNVHQPRQTGNNQEGIRITREEQQQLLAMDTRNGPMAKGIAIVQRKDDGTYDTNGIIGNEKIQGRLKTRIHNMERVSKVQARLQKKLANKKQ